MTLRFDGLLTGSATLRTADNWLKMDYDGSVMGVKTAFNIRLIPLRY